MIIKIGVTSNALTEGKRKKGQVNTHGQKNKNNLSGVFQLFNIAKSLQWLTDATNGNPKGGALMPTVLDFLPQILQHDLTKLVVLTTLDEVSRVEVPQAVMQAIQQQAVAEIKDPNSTLVPQRVQALVRS